MHFSNGESLIVEHAKMTDRRKIEIFYIHQLLSAF